MRKILRMSGCVLLLATRAFATAERHDVHPSFTVSMGEPSTHHLARADAVAGDEEAGSGSQDALVDAGLLQDHGLRPQRGGLSRPGWRRPQPRLGEDHEEHLAPPVTGRGLRTGQPRRLCLRPVGSGQLPGRHPGLPVSHRLVPAPGRPARTAGDRHDRAGERVRARLHGSRARARETEHLEARDFDELYDCPILVLLAFELVRRTVERAETIRPSGCRLLLGLSTNGLLLDVEKAAFLAAHGVDTQVSFDGCRAAQDLRAPGTFDALGERLEELRRRCPDFYGRRLEVALVVTPENLHALAASVRELLRRKVPRIALGPVMGAGVTWDASREAELDRQLHLVYRHCRSLYERTGRVPVTLFRRGLARPVANERGAMCGIGRGHSITVDVDGEVSACQLLARSVQAFSGPGLRRWVEPLRIGRLDARDLGDCLERFRAQVRRSPLFMRRERKHAGRRRCADCRYRASCHVCPVAIAHAGEDPHLVPEFLCAFRRVSLKYRERFPAQVGLLA